MSQSAPPFEREIFIAASTETVFGFLTDPALMMEWFGLAHTLEPQPMGMFRVDCGNGNIACGVYIDVVPYRRVAFTWGWESPDQILASLKPGTSLVEIDLEPREGGTLLRFRHSQLPENLRNVHRERWLVYLPALAAAAERREGQPQRLEGTDKSISKRQLSTSQRTLGST